MGEKVLGRTWGRKRAGGKHRLGVIETARIGCARVVLAGNAQTIGDHGRPRITMIDGRGILGQVEVIIRAAVVSPARCGVAEDIVGAIDVSEPWVCEEAIRVLAGSGLPVCESVLSGAIPEADMGSGLRPC